MKLNPDCIRDILITVESATTFSECLILPYEKIESCELLKKYDLETILYHVRQCEWSHLLKGVSFTTETLYVHDLYPSGHQFLNDIREDRNWNKVKSIAKKAGSNSLSALMQIATGVITSLISANLSD